MPQRSRTATASTPQEPADDKTRAAVKALAELCTACGVEEAALATSEVSAQRRLSERQIWLRDCTGAELLGKEKGISNPFHGAVQDMLHDQSMIGVSAVCGGFSVAIISAGEALRPLKGRDGAAGRTAAKGTISGMMGLCKCE
ncbi:unnamed protein product, partial [Symbiodinium necroappetens]